MCCAPGQFAPASSWNRLPPRRCIFAIRTRRVPSSAAGPVSCLTLAAFAVVAVGVTLTVSPLARQLGFTTLPWQFFTALVLFTIAYLLRVEMMKTVFYAA